VTVPEISEIRGVDSGGVIATLLDRKLVTTAGRKAVIGRPILYKTTKEFLLRFGLKDVNELPSMEELRSWLPNRSRATCCLPKVAFADATGIPNDIEAVGNEELQAEVAHQSSSEEHAEPVEAHCERVWILAGWALRNESN
jgi:segregation and condensation protein B